MADDTRQSSSAPKESPALDQDPAEAQGRAPEPQPPSTEDKDRQEADLDQEQDQEASEPSEASPPETWADKWWVWVLGGLAIAAFFGLLHILT